MVSHKCLSSQINPNGKIPIHIDGLLEDDEGFYTRGKKRKFKSWTRLRKILMPFLPKALQNKLS